MSKWHKSGPGLSGQSFLHRRTTLFAVILFLLGVVFTSNMWGQAVHAGEFSTHQHASFRPTLVPPRPTLTPTPPPTLDPGSLCLRLSGRRSDDGANTFLVYDVVVRNQNRTLRAASPKLFVPAGTDHGVEVLSLPEGAWVQEALRDRLVVNLPAISAGSSVTVTVRLQQSMVTEQMVVRSGLDWANRRPGITTILSNHVVLQNATVRGPIKGGHLEVQWSAAGIVLTGHGFTSYERISLWYQRKNGQTQPLLDTTADNQGTLQVLVSSEAVPMDIQILVASGACSKQSLLGSVTRP